MKRIEAVLLTGEKARGSSCHPVNSTFFCLLLSHILSCSRLHHGHSPGGSEFISDE